MDLTVDLEIARAFQVAGDLEIVADDRRNATRRRGRTGLWGAARGRFRGLLIL